MNTDDQPFPDEIEVTPEGAIIEYFDDFMPRQDRPVFVITDLKVGFGDQEGTTLMLLGVSSSGTTLPYDLAFDMGIVPGVIQILNAALETFNEQEEAD